MGSPALVVRGIGPERPVEMPPTEDERPVEALGPHRLDHALGVGVGVRSLDRRADHPGTFRADDLVERPAELRVPVSAQSAARWAVRLRSGSASSARTRDGAERDVDDPALHGHVCTPMVSLENLHEGRLQGAQLLVLLGLDGLDLRGVAEALEQLAELGLAFLRDLLPGREFLRLGRSNQLLGLRVADLQWTILQLLLAE